MTDSRKQSAAPCYGAAVLAVLSAACTLAGNWASLTRASWAELALYVILPMLAALGFAAVLLIRVPLPVFVVPVTLGGVLFFCMEAYVFQLVDGVDRFVSLWEFLPPALAATVMATAIGLLASLVVYILLVLGVLHTDIVAMAVVGVTILLLAAEYIVNLITCGQYAVPWYLMSVALFFGAMLLHILTIKPEIRREK